MRKNSIFIDRETALNPQENTDSHSEDIFSFSFQKITLFGGLVCDGAAIFISLLVSKMHYPCALFAAIYHVLVFLVCSCLIQEISVASFFT